MKQPLQDLAGFGNVQAKNARSSGICCSETVGAKQSPPNIFLVFSSAPFLNSFCTRLHFLSQQPFALSGVTKDTTSAVYFLVVVFEADLPEGDGPAVPHL